LGSRRGGGTNQCCKACTTNENFGHSHGESSFLGGNPFDRKNARGGNGGYAFVAEDRRTVEAMFI
jgi:hypothetical protein